jgi:hypothetical protein
MRQDLKQMTMASMSSIPYMAALVLAAAGPAQALNKCNVNGEVVFQDRPCPGAGKTVGQALDRKAQYQALQRGLDQLQAQGAGLVQRAPPKPASMPQADDRYVPRSRLSWDELQAQRRREDAEIQEQTEHNNAVSAAKLTQIGEQMQQGLRRRQAARGAHGGHERRNLPQLHAARPLWRRDASRGRRGRRRAAAPLRVPVGEGEAGVLGRGW